MLRILPGWVRIVNFRFDIDAPKDVSMRVQADYEYRQLRIRFAQSWLCQPNGLKLSDMVHELGHAFTAPMDEAVDNIGRIVKMKDDEREAIKTYWAFCLEQVACDLEAVMCDLVRRAYKV
jgi:hypothetical protein